jgi:uncharacterized membrane protein
MSYHNNINPFENYSGSMNLSKPVFIVAFSLSIVGLLVVKLGIIGIILVFALLFWVVFYIIYSVIQ